MKKTILIILALVIFSSWVYAVECGSVPTDRCVITRDTTFQEGSYQLVYGILVIGNNIVFNCNNALLEGIGNNSVDCSSGICYDYPGIYVVRGNNNTITNCNLHNYYTGILLAGNNNLIYNNIFTSNQTIWSFLTLYGTNNSTVLNNKMNGPSVNAIQIQSSSYFANSTNNYIHMNIINSSSGVSSHRYSISLNRGANFNKIWNNDIYQRPIGDFGIGNIFCIVCIDNRYYGGAFGPLCPSSCNDEDNDGVSNSEDKCPNTVSEQIVYGCSCEQILALKPGKDEKECSEGIIEVFTKKIGWAKDLF